MADDSCCINISVQFQFKSLFIVYPHIFKTYKGRTLTLLLQCPIRVNVPQDSTRLEMFSFEKLAKGWVISQVAIPCTFITNACIVINTDLGPVGATSKKKNYIPI